MGILFIMSAIFYTAIHFYTNYAIQNAGTQTPEVLASFLERLLALRMILSGCFCILIGFISVKLSGHVWPGVLIHTLVVLIIMLLDLPLEQMLTHWDITLLILATVTSITGVSGGLTLAFFWLRMKYPRRRRIK